MEATQISLPYGRGDVIWFDTKNHVALPASFGSWMKLIWSATQGSQIKAMGLFCFALWAKICVVLQGSFEAGFFFLLLLNWNVLLKIFRNYGKENFQLQDYQYQGYIIRTYMKVAWELWSMSLWISHSTSWVSRLELNIFPNDQSNI